MLVGRTEERRAIDAMLAAARLGSSGVLVLAGEAGIGKTTLLEYAAAGCAGFRVLRTAGVPGEQELPFAGLERLLRPLSGRLSALPEPQRDALSTSLALRPGRPGDRFAVAAATLTLLTSAGEEAPVAVFIDDAHLLDASSAEVLGFTARRLLADAVLLLAAVRDDTGELWPDLPRLVLGPLTHGEIGELAMRNSPGPLPAATRELIAEQSWGNPLAARALASEPGLVAALTPGQPAPLPSVLAKAFDRRAEPLGRDGRLALLAVVAAGGDLAATVAACRSLDLPLEFLDDAVRLGLVRITGDLVEFTHPLVAAAVHGSTAPADRRLVQRAVAATLPPSAADRRAWLLAEAALGPDEEAALELSRLADRAAARGAHATAARAQARAANLSLTPDARVSRVLAAAEAAWLAGQDRQVAEFLAEAGVNDARTQLLAGRSAARSGSLEHARDLLLAAASGSGVTAALISYAEAVDVCFFLLDVPGALRAADSAEPLVPGASGPAAAMAQVAIGMARIFAGLPGAPLIREGIAAFARIDGPTAGHQSSWEVLGPLFLRESGTGRELVDRAVRQRRSQSAMGNLPHLLFHLARDDATTNRWPQAEAGYSEAIGLAREFGHEVELALGLAGLAWLSARQGRGDACRRQAAEALALARPRQIRLAEAWSRLAVAELSLAEGSASAAFTELAAVAAWFAELDLHDPDLSPVPELVEAGLRFGTAPDPELVEDYLSLARSKGQPWSLARASRVRALLAGDDYPSLFEQAVEWHTATLDRY